MLLSAEHLSINFGSRQLLEDVNFYLNEGDKVGVIGINGTGKSTFSESAGRQAGSGCRNNLPESQRAGKPAGAESRPWRMTPPFWNRYSCISQGIPGAERI